MEKQRIEVNHGKYVIAMDEDFANKLKDRGLK